MNNLIKLLKAYFGLSFVAKSENIKMINDE